MSLTGKQKEQFLIQLQRDPQKDFNSEYTRVCELQMKLVEEYGFEGVKLVQDEARTGTYYNLGDFPNDSPWTSINKLSIPKAIDKIFKPLAEAHLLPEPLVDTLKERCKFLYAEKTEDNKWLLHYWLTITTREHKPYFIVITGGAPLKDPKPNAILKKFGWIIPEDLVSFYEVHDGFGEGGNGLVYPNEELTVMAEYMGKIKGDGYTFDNLLEVASDGAGNTICFMRESKKDESGDEVFDWDHETLELTDQYGFWGYLDEIRFDETDEEENEDYDDESDDEEEDNDFDFEDKKYEVIDFGKKFKITSSYKISKETIDKYRKVAPPALIHLWETHGLPVINEGLITFINPDEYFPTLDQWLGKHVNNYIPMAIGAFGNFFYYRKLEEGEEDVCHIEPHHREIDTCAWTFREFFENYLYDGEYTQEYILRVKEFKAAMKKNGPLAQYEMYMFVPALVLGGEESGKNTDKGDARVHLDFLFQATQ